MLQITSPLYRYTLGVDEVTSYWVPSFNIVPFTFLRRDAEVISVTSTGASLFSVDLQGQSFNIPSCVGKYVYLNSNQYNGVYLCTLATPLTNGNTRLSLDGGGINLGASTGGYINNLARGNYRVQVTLEMFKDANPIKITQFSNSALQSGQIQIDVAPALQDVLAIAYDHDDTVVNAPDTDGSGFFFIKYQEFWDDGSNPLQQLYTRFFFTYSSLQYRNIYGANMFEYVPLVGRSSTGITEPDLAKPGKFMTKFARPKVWDGWPFDLTFIYSEYLNGSVIQRQQTEHVPGFSFTSQTQLTTAGEEAVNYLNLASYTAAAEYLTVCLAISDTVQVMTPTAPAKPTKPVTPVAPAPTPPVVNYNGYNGAVLVDATLIYKPFATNYVQSGYVGSGYVQAPLLIPGSLNVVECINVDIVKDCVDQPFYLTWLNTLGGWDYYMFGVNQIDTIDASNDTTYQPYEFNLSDAERKVFDLQNERSQVFTLGSEAISKADLTALKDLFSSPAVFKLEQDGTATRLRVAKGSFQMFQTRDGFNRIEFDVFMPEVIVQRA